MKHVNLIIAKIRPEIYKLIENGKKTWEVRDKPFHTPVSIYGDLTKQRSIIQYTDPDGAPLGLWELDTMSEEEYWCELAPDGSFNDEARIALRRSCVSEELFRRIFSPKYPKWLYAIRLTRKLDSLTDLTGKKEPHA